MKRLYLCLIGIVVVLLCFAGWFAKQSNDAREQQTAIKGVISDEGIVQFDTTPNVPQWLKAAIGEEYFREEKVIDLATNKGRKTGTKDLKVSDDTLKFLSSLTGIETLELGNQREVTDSGLALLAPLRNLTTLYLYRTGVHGPGLAHLEELPKLQAISLDYTDVDDSGTKHLRNMPGLNWLCLRNSKVTDQGLAELANAASLKTLILDNTEITDVGLSHLGPLHNLEVLGVCGTNVTPEGVAQLKKVLPRCRVDTTFGLGMAPDDELLFASEYKPTANEINARLKELKIDGEVDTDAKRLGNPIVSLRLFQCMLSDRVILSLIEQMPDLEVLNLRNALVGDDLLKGLGPLPIRYLSLDGTRVTNDGLVHLSKFSKLEELLLNRTGVTGDGLHHLERLPQLQSVLLDDTRVTQDRIERLRQELPRLR